MVQPTSVLLLHRKPQPPRGALTCLMLAPFTGWLLPMLLLAPLESMVRVGPKDGGVLELSRCGEVCAPPMSVLRGALLFALPDADSLSMTTGKVMATMPAQDPSGHREENTAKKEISTRPAQL